MLYRSSPSAVTAFTYFRSDSAVLRVMFGPNMRMSKWLRNEISNDAGEIVKVNRGDTVSIILEAWNDVVSGDSTAHHVVIYDTFALIPFSQYGVTGCKVGPWDGVSEINSGNSFTYLAGSESASLGGTCTGPTKIAYYDSIVGWVGNGGVSVNISSIQPAELAKWITYNGAREASAPSSRTDRITGIAWYWPSVYSQNADSGNTAPYAVRVQFTLKKNDN